MTERAIVDIESTVIRLGIVLSPDGSQSEEEGVLNPASARDRQGRLILYPRCVARGNVSRVGIVRVREEGIERTYERSGFALEPAAEYEIRDLPGGYGCEDPRVTYVPLLDAYIMVYTAFGPLGPRIAFALSSDGYAWERLGLVDFSGPGLPSGDDKDGVFFPSPVISPRGVPSFAFYHRPMLHVSASNAQAAVPLILAMPPHDRESTRIAYIPLEAALADRRNLLKVAESETVLSPSERWGLIKNGAGTPPILLEEGWLSIFHAVDASQRTDGSVAFRYSAGIMIGDAERPHNTLYHSNEPILTPEGADECIGIVDNVVFPTAIDALPNGEGRIYDIYYGMADSRVGRARLNVDTIVVEGVAETAA